MKNITKHDQRLSPRRRPFLGARLEEQGIFFRVWAPERHHVDVALCQADGTRSHHPLTRDAEGYWSGRIAGIGAGVRYFYHLDGMHDRPDPASHAQPDGVHGPSMVVNSAFAWHDEGWKGLPHETLIIYELHVGTFSDTGTFDAVIEKLAYFKALGVTAIELMPVADFQGERNWGYDGVDLFAPARCYGGAQGLKRLVDAAHGEGLAVLLDVVYNHLGPSGNYLRDFSHRYFTDRHHTPWGDAPNFDGEHARPVRDFFIQNACYWMGEYHLDGLRLDAVHEIADKSDQHFLGELAEAVRVLLPEDRHYSIVAEHPYNNAKLALPGHAGGHGLNGIWADDFGHALRVTFDGEQAGHFASFRGGAEELAKILQNGWLYRGEPDRRTGWPRGSSADALAPSSLVYAIETHDYAGNRALGERLGHMITPAAYRAASALLLLSPGLPMLFMGQEWAATSPFLFFTDYDGDLGRMIAECRRKDYAEFIEFQKCDVPDPQALNTFLRSKLHWEELSHPVHQSIFNLYRDLIALRKSEPLYRTLRREDVRAWPIGEKAVALLLNDKDNDYTLLIAVNLEDSTVTLELEENHSWQPIFDTESPFRGDQEGEKKLDKSVKLSGPRTIVFRGIKCS